MLVREKLFTVFGEEWNLAWQDVSCVEIPCAVNGHLKTGVDRGSRIDQALKYCWRNVIFCFMLELEFQAPVSAEHIWKYLKIRGASSCTICYPCNRNP